MKKNFTIVRYFLPGSSPQPLFCIKTNHFNVDLFDPCYYGGEPVSFTYFISKLKTAKTECDLNKVLMEIYHEISDILKTAFALAIQIVKKNRIVLEKVALDLIKKESMDQDQFEKIVGKKDIGKKEPRT